MATDRRTTVRVGGTPVHGVRVDPATRCAHYGTERDVLAIRFACCRRFHPCFACHDALADHELERWPVDAREVEALLCGACGSTFDIATYLADSLACPVCDAAFNPGCVTHHDRYFVM